MPKGKVIIVQGGQWGSEAKGLICQKLAEERKVDVMVRTGTVNAGHTVYYKGKPYKMQQLPVGWVRPELTMVIGAGAFVHPDILEREITMVAEATGEGRVGVLRRLLIDRRCGLHLPIHTHRASDANRHHSMGATGKGCSEAVVDKITRRGMSTAFLFMEHAAVARLDYGFYDTTAFLNESYDGGKTILVEGTQGTLLDLHLGPYPYVTHKQTQAANWLAECGLSCTIPIELISVMRTYPIRVAGNSGPMPGEISWDTLASDINAKLHKAGMRPLVEPQDIVAWQLAMATATREMVGAAGGPPMPYDPAMWTAEEKKQYASIASEVHGQAWSTLTPFVQGGLGRLFERTTVTNKLRRLARWNEATARESVMLNRPTSVALTFMNYVFPEAWGCTRTTFGNLPERLRMRIHEYALQKQKELRCPVSSVGFGPLPEHTFSFYDGEL